MDCSPPGPFVHGIPQARILEWVAMFLSRGSFWPKDQTHISWTGRQILCHWATWEDFNQSNSAFMFYMLRISFKIGALQLHIFLKHWFSWSHRYLPSVIFYDALIILWDHQRSRIITWGVCVCVCVRASLVAQQVNNLPAMKETLVWFMGWEDLLEKGWVAYSFSCVWLFATPWTVACQALLSTESSRKETGVGRYSLSRGDLPDPGIKPKCPSLQVDSLLYEPPGNPNNMVPKMLQWFGKTNQLTYKAKI